eukprot:1565616-Amphidinium_carterae.1
MRQDRAIYEERARRSEEASAAADTSMAAEDISVVWEALTMELNEEEKLTFGESVVQELYSQTEFFDEYMGLPLRRQLVLKARAEELDYKNMEVFTEVPETEAWEVTGKAPVDCRWIDCNKGDQNNVKVRNRLVVREIKPKHVESIFTSTTPWPAF